MDAQSPEFATRPRTVGRPSTVAPYGPRISAWLSDEPAVTGAELLRRLQAEGYAGGKSALYELIRRLRAADDGR
jgi:hypothetical protein